MRKRVKVFGTLLGFSLATGLLMNTHKPANLEVGREEQKSKAEELGSNMNSDLQFEESKIEYMNWKDGLFKKLEYDDYLNDSGIRIKFEHNDLDRRNTLVIMMGTGDKKEYTFITKKSSLEIEFLEIISTVNGHIEVYEGDEINQNHRILFDEAIYHIKHQNDLMSV